MFLTLLGDRVLKPPPQEWLRASSGPGRGLDVFVRTTHLYAFFVLACDKSQKLWRVSIAVTLIASRIANVARTWIKMHYEEDFGGGNQTTTSALSVSASIMPPQATTFARLSLHNARRSGFSSSYPRGSANSSSQREKARMTQALGEASSTSRCGSFKIRCSF
jgi:hypothetical protein